MLNPYAFLLAPKLKNNKKIAPETKPSFEYVLFFDGCCKGNPGPAGAGAVLYQADEEIWADKIFVGDRETNNIAEYSSLILGLNEASLKGVKTLLVKGDSLLVINQMKRLYKINSENLKILYKKAKDLELLFDTIEYEHIPRSENSRADQLANEGLGLP
jgi:ribonuclease HI